MNELVRTLSSAAEAAQNRFLVGLVGAGIQASASPLLHETEGDELGLRCLYQLIDLDELELPPEAIGELLDQAHRLGFKGLNVTHPCKQLALAHLDELSPTTRLLGATNTVVFANGQAIGHNTDCSGFSRSFTLGLPGVGRGRAVLLGAGGAGTAVAHAALELGVGELTVVDIEEERAARLARALVARFGEGRALGVGTATLEERLRGADGLIHATPMGMASYPGMPLPPELLRPEMWVADIVYMPLETELLRCARELGCQTLDGGGMVVFQAAESFELFTRREPDRDRMLRHFATLVEAAVDPSRAGESAERSRALTKQTGG
ncbi:MAG: shikimate dehydrogenase [Solirubrobacterales bacterium]|nr:shikimate dehydrogenase [Solirubrobacterales bacterium]